MQSLVNQSEAINCNKPGAARLFPQLNPELGLDRASWTVTTGIRIDFSLSRLWEEKAEIDINYR